MKLDIGCGGKGSMYSGFIGIDLYPKPKYPRNKEAEYVQLDFVMEPVLPWKPNTVDEAVAFHIIEHMPRDHGVILIRRAYELLKPGAKLYVSCPDLRLLCQKYIDGDEGFWDKRYTKNNKPIWPGKTIADRLNWAIHQQGHVWSYDQESLTEAAKEAGCTNIEELPKDHFWSRRPDHETGIIITK